MKIACRKCKKIVESKQVKGIFGSVKVVCSICSSDNVKAIDNQGS